MSMAAVHPIEPDDTWAVARAAADLIVTLPAAGADGQAVEMFFRKIPATGPEGFQMGSRGGVPEEEPIHRVVIEEDLYLGTFVVTQEQWAAVWPGIEELYGEKGSWDPPGVEPSYFRGSGLLPVESVSWYDAMFFVQWLGAHGKWAGGHQIPVRSKMQCCLPTEAEWEWACRGGTATEYWNGDGEQAVREAAWYRGNSGDKTQLVTKPPLTDRPEVHPFGLFDIHGNVGEWCHDVWSTRAYRDAPDGVVDSAQKSRSQELAQIAAIGLNAVSSNDKRVARGGAWRNGAGLCRSASRFASQPGDRIGIRGFRVCWVVGESSHHGAALVLPRADVEHDALDRAGGARAPSGDAMSSIERQRAGREGSRE